IAKTPPCEAGTVTSVLTVLIAPVPASAGAPNLYSTLAWADQYFQPHSFSKSMLNFDSNLPFNTVSRFNPPDAVPCTNQVRVNSISRPCSFHRARVPSQSPVIVSWCQRSSSGDCAGTDAGSWSAGGSFLIPSEVPVLALEKGVGVVFCPLTA